MENRVSQQVGLGELIRRARRLMGLSQAELATKLGLTSGQSVSDWERGYGSRIPIRTLKTLIEVLSLDQKMVFEMYLHQEKEKLAKKIEAEFYRS
jgi:transcriptional regulator with XRE-family HTH domain